jgi:hypothetical protein
MPAHPSPAIGAFCRWESVVLRSPAELHDGRRVGARRTAPAYLTVNASFWPAA